ncbi:MAG: hypothetical protein HQ494_04780 [Rhodospirillales bacterium]|nr:hypothetical protein [Rhodospirillales bacterium]
MSAPVLTLLILLPVWLSASCAAPSVDWGKPGGSQDELTRDRWDCRAKARREADKNFRQRDLSSRPAGFDDDNTLSRDMSRFDAQRDERRMFEQCMALRGYTKNKAAR